MQGFLPGGPIQFFFDPNIQEEKRVGKINQKNSQKRDCDECNLTNKEVGYLIQPVRPYKLIDILDPMRLYFLLKYIE